MQKPSPQRFLPLDVFRGLTVCFMIIVNTPGWEDSYYFLTHAKWNGCTPTDMVFPSFLFAVGNAMSFSMRKFEQMENSAVLAKILRRTVLIFLLGYLMYWLPFVRYTDSGLEFIPIAETRILGVLQRIALCYCFASLLIHYLPRKAVWMVSGALLAGYWIIMYAFGDSNSPYSLTGNAALAADKFLFGDKHLYHGEGIPFDPEGLLSTLPAIVNVIAGYYAGLYVQKMGSTPTGLIRLLQAGVILIVAALLWNMVFPINKKLWTSSYVLYTVGIDLLILAFLNYVIDYKKQDKWTGFFTVFGKNPLFLYLLSEVLVIFLGFIQVNQVSVYKWLNINIFQRLAPGKPGSLLFALVFMMLCWSVGKVLDKKRIYVRV